VECPFREISFRELSAGVVGVVEADVGPYLDDECRPVGRFGHPLRQVDADYAFVRLVVLEHVAESGGVDREQRPKLALVGIDYVQGHGVPAEPAQPAAARSGRLEAGGVATACGVAAVGGEAPGVVSASSPLPPQPTTDAAVSPAPMPAAPVSSRRRERRWAASLCQ
jgi:hypothetical protein